MTSLKKAWSDPVWSKVISALILAALGTAASYFLNWWPGIGKGISAVFGFLGRTTPVWNWLIGVVSIVTLVLMLVVWLASVTARQSGTAPPYTSDDFFGVKWRWRYTHGEITGLYSLCVNCGLQIYLLDASDYTMVPRVAFRCDDCGKTAGPFDRNCSVLREPRDSLDPSEPKRGQGQEARSW